MADTATIAPVAYALPWWMQWAQAIGVGVISGLGAWIALKQSRIATAKLNLDLYDRRFKVFEGARTLVAKILQEGRPASESILQFNIKVADATFLFESDVERYLVALRKKATSLHAKGEQLRAMDEPGERRNQLVDEIASLEMDFSVEYERMVAVFKPYLNLGNI
jgi:hypothetical protein